MERSPGIDELLFMFFITVVVALTILTIIYTVDPSNMHAEPPFPMVEIVGGAG